MAMGLIEWIGAGVVVTAGVVLGYVAALIVTKGKRAGASAALADRLAEADHDSALLQALERIASSSNRKVWADRVSAVLASLTGASGAAVVLRSPASDSMSLAGSSVPLVIRNLEASLREPHGPSQRALAAGEPVSMSVGELPAWAAAAGYEAGAVIPVPFHGASIGLVYVLGKQWESPSAASLAAAARFVALAAVHYSLAVPYPAVATSTAALSVRPSASAPGYGREVSRSQSSAVQPAPPSVAVPTQPAAASPGMHPVQPPLRTPALPPVRPPAPPPALSSTPPLAPAPRPSPALAPTPSLTPSPAQRAGSTEVVGTRRPAQRIRIDLPGVAVDPATDRCVIDGRAVSLSRTEFDLLYALASSGGDIVSAGQLARAVWGEAGTPSGTLDVTIHRLRRKLGRAPGGADLVRTVRGRGYAIGLPTPGPARPDRIPARAAAD